MDMLSDWKSVLVTWWKLRRRFAQEWAFHREASIAEFEALGYSRRRARIAARQRMGSRARHRRAALSANGGTWNALIRQIPIRPNVRNPRFLPCALMIGLVLLLWVNPERSAAWRCVKAMLLLTNAPHLDRFVPLTPRGVVPVEIPAMLLRIAGAVGLVWALWFPGSIRSRLYAASVFIEILFSGALVWTTGVQILARRSWGHDLLQGFALFGFSVAFSLMLYLAIRLWQGDVQKRCPRCLSLPGMSLSNGKLNDLLIDPRETDSICFRGHGSVLQTRWSCRFRPAERLFPMDPRGIA
jgi:hypothetical protein